jgi:dolichyl-phosphate beta-glucosyltransferase
MMHLNNFLVKTAIGIDYIKDTQCGFKLFTRRAANRIFTHMHLNRWAFDVEMFYIGKHLNIPVLEKAVNWREIEGSKLNVFAASISFIRDYLSIIFFYTTNLWKIMY